MEFRWISGSGGLGGSYWARSQKMPSSRKCSHRNSVQNGPIDSFTALMGTIFVAISVFMSRAPKVDPDPKNVFATKLLAPKFCAECTDQQLHSSHGDYFRCHFCVYVSGPLSSNLRATFGQLWTIGGSGDSKIRSGSPGVWPICDKILHVARPDPATFCIGSFWHIFQCML